MRWSRRDHLTPRTPKSEVNHGRYDFRTCDHSIEPGTPPNHTRCVTARSHGKPGHRQSHRFRRFHRRIRGSHLPDMPARHLAGPYRRAFQRQTSQIGSEGGHGDIQQNHRTLRQFVERSGGSRDARRAGTAEDTGIGSIRRRIPMPIGRMQIYNAEKRYDEDPLVDEARVDTVRKDGPTEQRTVSTNGGRDPRHVPDGQLPTIVRARAAFGVFRSGRTQRTADSGTGTR